MSYHEDVDLPRIQQITEEYSICICHTKRESAALRSHGSECGTRQRLLRCTFLDVIRTIVIDYS
jgi:hypothetical protein